MMPGETAGMSQRWPPGFTEISAKFQRTVSAPSLRACLIRSTYQGPRQGATMRVDWDETHVSFDAAWNCRAKTKDAHACQSAFHRRSLVRAARPGGRSQGPVARVRRAAQACSGL